MATLRDIKKRINSVRSTQKITKAMKMVAAAKLRRAQMAVIGSRPYAQKLKEVLFDMINRSKDRHENPLYMGRAEVKRIVVLVYSSNRGLCGGFNSNLLRQTENFIRERQGLDCGLVVIGRKGWEYFKVRRYQFQQAEPGWAEALRYEEAFGFARANYDAYLAGEFDEYYLAYNRFKSAISQEVTFEKLFPLSLSEAKDTCGVDYIYEPSQAEILETLLPRYLATQVYKAHLESQASELGARMTAMDNATNNASEMISSLTLQYNRARQAAITTELMDIVNGAEALG